MRRAQVLDQRRNHAGRAAAGGVDREHGVDRRQRRKVREVDHVDGRGDPEIAVEVQEAEVRLAEAVYHHAFAHAQAQHPIGRRGVDEDLGPRPRQLDRGHPVDGDVVGSRGHGRPQEVRPEGVASGQVGQRVAARDRSTVGASFPDWLLTTACSASGRASWTSIDQVWPDSV